MHYLPYKINLFSFISLYRQQLKRPFLPIAISKKMHKFTHIIAVIIIQDDKYLFG